MTDLTRNAFAYLKAPLALAAIAFFAAAVSAYRSHAVALAISMVLFFHAARLALVAFDPYLGSRSLAESIPRDGTVIVDDQYYAFSTVFFYAQRPSFLLNGRINNLEYGSFAPGSPNVFIDDRRFTELWRSPRRMYLVAAGPSVPRFQRLVGKEALRTIASSGGKFVFSNRGTLGD